MAHLSPLRYPGGKGKTYKYVRSLVQKNNITTYIEPFAGGAEVALQLLMNNDVKRIIINDFDPAIYALWRAVIYQADELIQLIKDVPITPEEWQKQKDIYNSQPVIDELKLGFATLFLNRANHGGVIKGGITGGKHQTGNSKIDARFNKKTLINRIRSIEKFKKRITVCNYDAIDFIEEEIKKTRKSLTFFDPPYYIKGPGLYTNFYTHDDHVALAQVIKSKMKNRYWILTYDIAEEIKQIYIDFKPKRYSLSYSISKPTKGEEFIFFSEKICSKDIGDYLRLIPD